MRGILVTAVAALAAFVGFKASAIAQTAVGDATVAFLPGECRLLLNGTDVGCTNGAAHSAFKNGRHLLNFAGTDIATVGFAGARVQPTGKASTVLWVDAVYINQQRLPADGQCSYEQGASRAELKCNAILRDGRKLASQLSATAQKEAFLGLGPWAPKTASCEELLELHGLLSRAQFQCGFNHYKQSMLDDARRCAASVGSEAAKKQVASGMEIFDYNEGKRGRAAMCSSILENFPDLIRR